MHKDIIDELQDGLCFFCKEELDPEEAVTVIRLEYTDDTKEAIVAVHTECSEEAIARLVIDAMIDEYVDMLEDDDD